MSDSNTGPKTCGIGLLGATFIVFLALKLTGHIDWSWWWVAAPLWGPWAAVLVFVLVVGLGLGVAAIIEKLLERKR